MLSFIGLCALLFVCIKYFPELIKFGVKVFIVLLVLWLFFATVAWVFGWSLAIHFNDALLQIQSINGVGV